ncbi:unnamed protein product [Euphydryas editha]|uniref:Uncharacterized protein n=1 Tax=Euphydryas editha TaxID=104508 RepID=A0AAU9V4N4_EUPED|nr:unnamed protein product [Euphydryas editha]
MIFYTNRSALRMCDRNFIFTVCDALKTLRSGKRQLILKVKKFCEREKANKAPLIPFENARRREAAMAGISEETVKKQEGAVAPVHPRQVIKKYCLPDGRWKFLITSHLTYVTECDHVRGIEEKYYANDFELDNFIIEIMAKKRLSDTAITQLFQIPSESEDDQDSSDAESDGDQAKLRQNLNQVHVSSDSDIDPLPMAATLLSTNIDIACTVNE